MAQDSASNNFYDFMYGKYLLKDLFDIVMNDDDYVERAYNVFRDIGNIATATHAFEFEITDSLEVQLPCNVEFVEAVSSGTRTVDDYGNELIVWHADWPTPTANYYLADVIQNPNINKRKLNNQASQLHPDGEFIPYQLEGTVGNYRLVFTEDKINFKGVCIYRGIVVDQEGNPLLSRKEAEAIAYKLAFINLQKRAFMGDKSIMDMLSYAQNEAGRKMAAAKIAEHMSQNEINRIMSALTSHNRKVYWSSYKSIQ